MKKVSSTADEFSIGHPHIRPRRLRQSPFLRSLVQEHFLRKTDFIYPIFVSEQGTAPFEIASLPGISRIPLDALHAEVSAAYSAGVRGIMLFPVVAKEKKDLLGSEAYNPDGLMQRSILSVKKDFPDLVVFADVALDPYTIHGHDGLLDQKGTVVLNDETVQVLCRQSLSYAECGVDFVCPSDMMDGRIAAIRQALDHAGYCHTSILSYSAKFHSSFYGPFRQAVGSGARGLDKKTYQLNYANVREALREVDLDISEGADMVLVKPGLPYLDILAKVKAQSQVPVVVYQVSGEYALLKFAALHDVIDEKDAVLETFLAMKRAGADLIVSYYAKWACEHIL